MIFILIQSCLALESYILADLNVTGSFECENLSSNTLNSAGQVTTTSTVTTTDTTTTTAKAKVLAVNDIYPQSGVLTIDSDLVIYPPPGSANFYQVNWELFNHFSFEDSNEGWTGTRVKCNGQFFLEGGKGRSVSKQVRVSGGSFIKLSANVHFIDCWIGESVVLKVGKKIVWMHQGESGDVDVCGGSENDAAYGVPVEAAFEYHGEVIEFASDVRKGTFGVDNIIIYVK